VTPEDLDRRCGTSPAERDELRAGRLPDRFRRGARAAGVLAAAAAAAGAAAGAFFAWNIAPLAAGRLGVAPIVLVGAGAAAGAALAGAFFHARFGPVLRATARMLREGEVHVERLSLRLDLAGDRLRLVAGDGRTFQPPAGFGSEPFSGEFTSFYVDVPAEAMAAGVSPLREPHLLVALEPAQ